ncbi:unnamed protein product [Lactuca virosa]|uniref:Protein NIM1-INTERACTING 2 n=1 Tax=Lactuca virosa TaxID=75947 RepID=A0AAU9NNR4_9ASTR|nr:unnamed protein product [Lactuca virosa]CAH1439514.1 unnamed protein product [Lactuca virosa]
MERDQKKRSRAVDGGSGGGGHRKKEKDGKGKIVEIDSVVVPPPTEDEVDEFFAILRRMREAVKYFEKGNVGCKLSDPSREPDDGLASVNKGTNVALLDLNTVPDEGE